MKKRYEKSISNVKFQIANKDNHIQTKHQESEKLISSAKENVLRGKYFTKEVKEQRRIEDMKTLFGNNTGLQTDNITNSQPERFFLSQNYPNPFNPVKKISYELPVANHVTLKVFDILGKEVMTLVNERQDAGNHEIEFNGSSLSSGVYFYRLEAGEFTDVKRMVLIK